MKRLSNFSFTYILTFPNISFQFSFTTPPMKYSCLCFCYLTVYYSSPCFCIYQSYQLTQHLHSSWQCQHHATLTNTNSLLLVMTMQQHTRSESSILSVLSARSHALCARSFARSLFCCCSASVTQCPPENKPVTTRIDADQEETRLELDTFITESVSNFFWEEEELKLLFKRVSK